MVGYQATLPCFKLSSCTFALISLFASARICWKLWGSSIYQSMLPSTHIVEQWEEFSKEDADRGYVEYVEDWEREKQLPEEVVQVG
jgi:hypothetical protein